MNSGRPDSASAEPRDPRVDAAWRAAAREEPPAALDAAILAAARRAVDAGPQPAAVREATRPERWWWPLAAAASIGAVAIGVLQLTAPDRTVTFDRSQAIVSDLPAGTAPAPASRPAFAPVPERSSAPTSGAAVVTPSVSGGDDATLNESAALRKRQESPRRDKAEQAAPPAVPMSRDRAAVVAQPQAMESRARAKLARPPAEAEAAVPSNAGRSLALPPLAESVVAPAAPSPRSDVGNDESPARAAQPFPADAAAPSHGERDSARPETLGNVVPGPATATRADMQARERTPRPVAEWIALIRKLKAEGKREEFAREIAAFQAAYPDQQQRLADELRDEPPAAPAR